MSNHGPVLLPTPTRCRQCGARIRWCHSLIGNRVPIDAEPSADGALMLVLVDGQWVCEHRRTYRAIALRDLGLELYHYHRCDP